MSEPAAASDADLLAEAADWLHVYSLRDPDAPARIRAWEEAIDRVSREVNRVGSQNARLRGGLERIAGGAISNPPREIARLAKEALDA
jgi:hypothetical protein